MSVCPFTAPLLPSSSFCNALMAFYDKILHKKSLGEEVLPWLMTFWGEGVSQSITAGEDMMGFSAMGVYGGGC